MGFPKCTYEHIDLLADEGFPVGCTLKGGVLSPSLGAVNTNAKPITDLAHLHAVTESERFIAHLSSGKFAHGPKINGTAFSTVSMPMPATSPFSIEVRNGTYGEGVIFADKYYMRMRNNSNYMNTFAGNLRCGVWRCGRLFGGDLTVGALFKWSGEGGYTDWKEGISGAGQVYLEPVGGQILDVFDFQDRIIILRENAITEFFAGGNPENFRVGQTVLLPKVYPKTGALAGGILLFFTEDGLYKYINGGADKVQGLITRDMTEPVNAYTDGLKYFLAGRSQTLKRVAVFIYDVEEGTYCVADAPAYYLSADAVSPIAYDQTAIYRIQSGVPYSFACKDLNFGEGNRRLATHLSAEVEGEVYAEVKNQRYTLKIPLKTGKNRLNMRGDKFGVTITGSGTVRSLSICTEVRK